MQAERTCACGCGADIKPGNRYLHGHNTRSSPVHYIVDPVTGCWEWQLAKRGNGYGKLKRNGKHVSAHRWYYTQFVGPIPSGLHIDHLCRNRACVNPEHLEAVERRENMRRAGVVKLTQGAADQIRRDQRSAADVATVYGCSVSHVYLIRSGKIWKHDARLDERAGN